MPMLVPMSMRIAVDLERRTDGLDDAGGERLGLARIAHARLDDGELVAAEPGDEIAVAHAGEQPLAHLLEQRVADRMAQRVVDGLEVVEVEAEHGEALPAQRALQALLQLLPEQHAVGEARQRIVARKVGDPLLLPPALGDVLVQRHPAAALEGLARDRDDAAVAELDHAWRGDGALYRMLGHAASEWRAPRLVRCSHSTQCAVPRRVSSAGTSYISA